MSERAKHDKVKLGSFSLSFHINFLEIIYYKIEYMYFLMIPSSGSDVGGWTK